MKCTACQQDNHPSAKFCAECGAKLLRACSACGAALNAVAKFCSECGSRTDVAESAGRPQARSVRAYTPKHLADKILQSKSALEGERKQVTVLFADIMGSMELAEQLDAEQWHQILDRFFQILNDGVHRFEGTINQYTGDGVMALFGAPIAHEDHAQRACYAALHLRDEIARYATAVKRAYGVSFSTRMGLNSGDVVVGSIGDDLRMDYTAQGHTVGLAQRMEALAAPDTCYLTAATAALVGGYISLEDLGEFQVKGVTTPVRVHRLAGVGVSRNHFDLARARGLSRLVGRAGDLRTLEDALAQTIAGNGQVVGIVADAGTGKSRLCFEFLERCRARGLRVVEGRCVAHGSNIPLLPILEVFRAYFGITLQDDDRSAREKIAGSPVMLNQRHTDVLPVLFDFLGVGDPARPASKLAPETRQRQLAELMRQATQVASETQPMVTLIEDLHWLDSASAEFLEYLVEARAGTRSLLLLNFRPEYRAEWMQRSWYRQIPLTPLGPDATAELLTDLLGHDASLAGLAAAIHARTDGNPFFTEELAQSMVEGGQLVGRRGAYRLATPIATLDVPATVQTVLAARIDRLAEREKRLLQTAAVIGKEFSEPLVAAVAELPAEELKVSLAILSRAELIHELALYPVAEYAFKHPLTQEIALGSQLRERRRQLHAAVARAIEQSDLERLDDRAALLAHHWEEAGEALNAARWHQHAAESPGCANFSGAIRHWQRVRALLRERPFDHESAGLSITACTRLLNLRQRIGIELDDARALFDEGSALALQLGDRRAELNLLMGYARTLWGAGDVTGYLEMARQNQRAALAMDDLALQTSAWGTQFHALCLTAQFPAATAMVEAGLAHFSALPPPGKGIGSNNAAAFFALYRAYCLNWTGRLGEGLDELERCRGLAEEGGELAGFSYVYTVEAYYHLHDADRAFTAAQQLEALNRNLGEPPIMSARAQFAIGCAHLAAGHAAEAIQAARAANELFARVDRANAGVSATLLAEALLAAGDLAAAESAAMIALTHCRRSQRDNYAALAHGVMARTLLRRDGPAASGAAATALNAAADLIKRTGARTLEPALCEWRAELAATQGDVAMYGQLLRQAEIGYAANGATRHAARLAAKIRTS